jgi:hypothetical protein
MARARRPSSDAILKWWRCVLTHHHWGATLNRQIEAMQGVRPGPRWREKAGAAVMPL